MPSVLGNDICNYSCWSKAFAAFQDLCSTGFLYEVKILDNMIFNNERATLKFLVKTLKNF